jgi:hypothetical protein
MVNGGGTDEVNNNQILSKFNMFIEVVPARAAIRGGDQQQLGTIQEGGRVRER